MVVATGHKKVYKKAIKQRFGQGKASKRKVRKQPWQLQWHRSDKHENGSRVATPKGSGSRQLREVHKHVHKA